MEQHSAEWQLFDRPVCLALLSACTNSCCLPCQCLPALLAGGCRTPSWLCRSSRSGSGWRGTRQQLAARLSRTTSSAKSSS